MAATAPTTSTTTTAASTSAAAPKIVLHWLNDSRAQRIAWLFEELGLEYEIKEYYRLETKLAPPELKAIHPLGRSPVVTIPEENLTLAESGFIIQYFTSRFGKLQPPPGSPPSVINQFNYLLHLGEGTIMPPLLITYIFEQLRNAPLPFFIKPVTTRIISSINNAFLTKTLEDNFKYLEGLLEGKMWFVGEEFSGADVLLSYPMIAARRERVKGFGKENYPNLWAWMERIEGREGYKRAEERTESFEKLGKK